MPTSTIARRLCVLGVVTGLVAVTAMAALREPAAPLAPAAPAAPLEPSAAPAEKQLAASAEAYRTAAALTDEVLVRVGTGARANSIKVGFAFAKGDLRLETAGLGCTLVGDELYVQRTSTPTKYFHKSVTGDVVKAISGIQPLPIPQVGIMHGVTLEDFIMSFGVPRVSDAQIEGTREVRSEGRVLNEVELSAASYGALNLKVRFDPKTNFMHGAELSLGPQKAVFTMKPRAVERLAKPIAFATGGLRRVGTIAGLALGKGDLAPDFTLETLDGEQVVLSEHRGSVVVLDFWATWCSPCRQGLPLLDQVHRWAEQNEVPVKVFPVDIGERQPTHDAKRKHVAKYWNGKGFQMTTLLDLDNRVARAYEVGPIPHTTIIGPDGRIIDVELGFNPRMSTHLKKVAREALNLPEG